MEHFNFESKHWHILRKLSLILSMVCSVWVKGSQGGEIFEHRLQILNLCSKITNYYLFSLISHSGPLLWISFIYRSHRKLKWSIRMYWSTLFLLATVSFREVLQNCDISGITFCTGTDFILPIYTLHRDPKTWERPNEFWQERL